MPSQSGASFRSFLGIPASKPSPADTVLIIVDAQNEYAHGLLAIHEVEKSRKVIGQVVQKWRSAPDGGGKVVHVLHKTPEGAPLFTAGTELEREFEELEPMRGEEVIEKNKPCAFSDTGLDKHLKTLGMTKILLVGKKPL
ncbi:MAG: hypothetical protein Q9220_006256 [cf. Caloplaca sp. 1 TL-2023]